MLKLSHLKPKLILHCHDHLHMIQTVQTKIIDEVTVQSELVSSDLVKSFAHIHHPRLYLLLTLGSVEPLDCEVSPCWVLLRGDKKTIS